MTFNGAEHPLRDERVFIPRAEMITSPAINAVVGDRDDFTRPFGYDKGIVAAEYKVNGIAIEVTKHDFVYLGILDGTSYDGFILGSKELDEFITILSYHQAKAKGEIK